MKKNLSFQVTLLSKISTVIVLIIFLSMLFLQLGNAAPKTPEFIGAKKCKICHNKPDKGAQYNVWKEMGHASAFEALAGDSAKSIASKLGIDNPQTSPKCLKCHTTVYHWEETPATNISTKKNGTPRLSVEEGVSCESCHNAGSIYQKKKTMKSFEKSVKAGMNPHPEKSCIKCHNSESPTWDTNRYTLPDSSKSGFDVVQALEKIKHPNPKNSKKKSDK